MSTIYILYNPNAGGGGARVSAEALWAARQGAKLLDMSQITNWKVFLQGLLPEDQLILVGGDGTLNHFINALQGQEVRNRIFYYPAGSGNDFARDRESAGVRQLLPLNPWLRELPTVQVNGQSLFFLNAVGHGIDGWCCVEGDRLRAKGKKPNYTMITIRGLLHGYKPTGATVCVDGQSHRFERAWLAPTMYGRFYGGGMMPAPQQRRGQNTLSLMVMHGSGKLRTLSIFPGIFSGNHIKHHKSVAVLSGREITVTFDQPRPLQVDGEVIPDVRTYTARI